jgi:hypothetical protein
VFTEPAPYRSSKSSRCAQLAAAKRQLKGERLTRDLMTAELRKALAANKRSGRALAERGAEIERLKVQVQEFRQHAVLAHEDLAEKEGVVNVR